jgi:signal transduction histidine kinase
MESIETSRKELSAWNHIWRTHHPDGNVYWHEGFGIPKKQEDGSVLWNSIILDVTERVAAESKLQEQEEYWEMLTRHASDGIIVCDAHGKLVFFNDKIRSWQGDMDASLKPGEWAEAYGLYTLDGSRLLSPDEIELCRALQGETVTNFRHSVKTPGKPLRYVESSGGPLYDNAGNQIGAMVLVRDITDRYQREYEITNAVIEAAELERERISAELHDSVAQELSIVSLNLNNYQLENPAAAESIRLLKARAYLEKALDETRSISHRMVPGTVRDLGLAGAVRELVEDLNASGSTEIAFTCNFNTRLEPSQELDLFRIIQEALHNVIRHAGALLAAVDIRRKGDELEVTISDNGRGFRGTQATSKKLGIGLRTMRNRTLKWGGDLKIQSDQGSTIVHAVIPIKEAP